VVDDIQIRSVNNLFRFLKEDKMFRLEEVVRATAFFTRTDAPMFDPLGDNWWEQQYNARPLLRYTLSERLRMRIPLRIRRQVRCLGQCGYRVLVNIQEPGTEAAVGATGVVTGTASVPRGGNLWVLARRVDMPGWWPQGGGPVQVKDGAWQTGIRYGEAVDVGSTFEIAALIVGSATHAEWMGWYRRAKPHPIVLPATRYVMGEAFRTVRKVGH
jgi:hypothetical protein